MKIVSLFFAGIILCSTNSSSHAFELPDPASKSAQFALCMAGRAIVASAKQKRELKPWEALDCIPYAGKVLALLYAKRMPFICKQGPGAFEYWFSNQSVYLTDRTRESYSLKAYEDLCGRKWKGKPFRSQVHED